VNCKEFLKELSDYLDGAMDEGLRSELEDHLTWCHDCYVICNTTKMTIQIYRDNRMYDLPDDLRGRLHNAIVARCQSSKKKTIPDKS